MSAQGISDAEFERQYAAVKNAKTKPELKALIARYDQDAKELVVKLTNGSTIVTPIELLGEFEDADPKDIAAVELTPQKNALHWEKLDQDFSIGGLISTVFGQDRYMAELGRKGGSVTTPAKASASRENGRKGGRPRKGQKSPFVLHLVGAIIHPPIELIDPILSGQSQQSSADLIKYKEGLISIERSVSPRRKSRASYVLAGSETLIQAKIEGAEESDDYATLAPAA